MDAHMKEKWIGIEPKELGKSSAERTGNLG